jgi:hypothetical protein
MKKITFKNTSYAMLLMGVIASPSLFAQDCCNEIVNAINNSTNTIGGKLDRNNQDSNSRLDVSKDYLGKLWNARSNDISWRQGVAALINYQAAEIFRKYQYDLQLLYQAAPGSDWAISAGVIVGKTPLVETAMALNNIQIATQLGMLGAADKITVQGVEVDIGDARKDAEPLTLYDKLKDFFIQGNMENFTSVNPGSLLFRVNYTKDNVSPANVNQVISILTDPFPAMEEYLKNKLKFGGLGLTGAEKERLVTRLVYGAVMGLSTGAFADIAARRTPAPNTDKSVMEVMNDYSNQRFTDPDWYKVLGAASDSAILRELAHMQAYNIWVQNQQFRVAEQQLALMASLNAMMSKISYTMNEIIDQLEIAQAEAKAAQAEANREAERADSMDDEEEEEK